MPAELVTAQSPRRAARRRTPPGPAARYRLDVIAGSIEDLVCAAGGWLADRALAGWDVVVAGDPGSAGRHAGALRILGATLVPPDAVLAPDPATTPTVALAVASDLLVADPLLRNRVVEAYDRDLAELTIWGAEPPVELRARLGAVQHTLSLAARAFKTRALALASAQPPPVAGVEMFHSGTRRSVADDLAPLDAARADGAVR